MFLIWEGSKTGFRLESGFNPLVFSGKGQKWVQSPHFPGKGQRQGSIPLFFQGKVPDLGKGQRWVQPPHFPGKGSFSFGSLLLPSCSHVSAELLLWSRSHPELVLLREELKPFLNPKLCPHPGLKHILLLGDIWVPTWRSQMGTAKTAQNHFPLHPTRADPSQALWKC